jgi:hypothetical protein
MLKVLWATCKDQENLAEEAASSQAVMWRSPSSRSSSDKVGSEGETRRTQRTVGSGLGEAEHKILVGVV